MVVSLKSSLFLAFVAGQMVCVTVKILPSDSYTFIKNNVLDELEIEIIHGGLLGFRTELPVRRERVGVQCLKEKEKFYIRIKNEDLKILRSYFFLAFDSEKYNAYETFSDDIKEIVGQEFCITWGTYSPMKSSYSDSIDFYFNIYKNKADLLSKYLFFFEITNGIFDYFVKLDLGWVQPDATEPKKGVTKTINLTYKECKDLQSLKDKKRSFSFREHRSYAHSEYGVFRIAHPVDKSNSLENEVNRAIDILKTDPASQISSLNQNSWYNGIVCGNEVFKYELGQLTLQKKGSQILI